MSLSTLLRFGPPDTTPSLSLAATRSPFDELLIEEDIEAQTPQVVLANVVDTTAKSYSCSYVGCNKVFRNSSKLCRHFRTHTGERPFLCAYGDCGKSFSRREHLRRHLHSHTGTRPFPCTFSDDCQYSFVDAHALKRHLRTHERELPYVCASVGCSAAFNKSHQLREHMFVHTGLKAFACSHAGCTQSFVGKAALHRHEKAHGKLYACPQCSCSFARHSQRQLHVRDAHPLRCEHAACGGKRFRCRSRLRVHMRTHDDTGKQRVVCPRPECGKSFSTPSNLQTHVRTRHPPAAAAPAAAAAAAAARRFPCTQCDSAFAYKQSLQRHHDRVHSGEPVPAAARRSRRHSLRTTLCGRPKPTPPEPEPECSLPAAAAAAVPGDATTRN